MLSTSLLLPPPPTTPRLRRYHHPNPLLRPPNLRPLNPPNKTPSPAKRHHHHHQGVCRAELVNDAPFVAAIGGCIINSLVFPVRRDEKDDGDGETIGSTDVMLAAMGVISFIPYFNWMSWVFLGLDTERRRYFAYAAVYLLPYLRTNLSLSPEESWLPIASIILCIIHVQMEISIINGDLSGIMLLDEVRELFSKSKTEEGQSPRKSHSKERRGRTKLPSAKIRDWNVPSKPLDRHRLEEDVDEEKRKSD